MMGRAKQWGGRKFRLCVGLTAVSLLVAGCGAAPPQTGVAPGGTSSGATAGKPSPTAPRPDSALEIGKKVPQ